MNRSSESKHRWRTIAVGLGALFLLAGMGIGGWFYLHRDRLKRHLVTALNRHLTVRTSVEEISTTLLSDFPNFSVVFHRVMVAMPDHPRDTFLAADQIGFSFDLWSLLRQQYHFSELFVRDARLHLRQAPDGKWQYRIWKADTTATGSTPLKISLLDLKNVAVFVRPTTGAPWHTRIRHGQISLNRIPAYLAFRTALEGELYQAGPFDTLPYQLTTVLRWYETGDSLRLRQASGTAGQLEWNLTGSIRGLSRPTPHVRLAFEGSHPHIEALAGAWLPDSLHRAFSLNGALHIKGTLTGPLSSAHPPHLQGRFNLQDASGHLGDVSLKTLSLQGTFEKKKDKAWNTFQVRIPDISGTVAEKPFKGKGILHRWEPLDWEGRFSYTWDLKKWLSLWNPAIKADGEVVTRMNIRYRKSAPTPWQITGWARAEHISITDADTFPITIDNLHAEAKRGEWRIYPMRLTTPRSDATLEGRMLPDRQWKLSVHAQQLHWDDIMQMIASAMRLLPSDPAPAGEAAPTTPTTIEIRARRFLWPPLAISAAKATVKISDTAVTFHHFKGRTLEGSFEVPEGTFLFDPPTLSVQGRMHAMNLRLLFKVFHDFDQTAISYRNLKGTVTGRGTVRLPFDSANNVRTSGIKATVDVRIDSGAILNYRALTTMMKFIKLRRLENLHFTRLRNRIIIRNDTVRIPTMHINSNEFSMWVRGYHTFANDVEYYVRLNLNELIFGKKKYPHLPHGYVPEQGRRGIVLYLHLMGPADAIQVKYAPRLVKKMLKIKEHTIPETGYEVEWD